VAVRPSEVAGRGVQPKEWLVMHLYGGGGGGGNKGRAYTHMYTIYVYVCTYMYVFLHVCIRMYGVQPKERLVHHLKGGGGVSTDCIF